MNNTVNKIKCTQVEVFKMQFIIVKKLIILIQRFKKYFKLPYFKFIKINSNFSPWMEINVEIQKISVEILFVIQYL
jgi:hypothetical protein